MRREATCRFVVLSACMRNGELHSQATSFHVQVMCEKGGYQVSNRPALLVSAVQEEATSVPPVHSSFVTRYAEAYRSEIEHFLDVLEGISIDI